MSTCCIIVFLISLSSLQFCSCDFNASQTNEVTNILKKIEGTVEVSTAVSDDWIAATKVCLDGGKYCGFLRSSGDFVIHNVPPGSYLVEVYSPNYEFQSLRMDISMKGNIRARHEDILNKNNITRVPYPLHFQAEKQAEFFEERKDWEVVETIRENPTVLLMVPLVLLTILLPLLMKDMDFEHQNPMQAFQTDIPTLEELFTKVFNFLLGVGAVKKKRPNEVQKKGQKKRPSAVEKKRLSAVEKKQPNAVEPNAVEKKGQSTVEKMSSGKKRGKGKIGGKKNKRK